MRQYVWPMLGDQRGGGPAVHSRRRRIGRRALGTAAIGVVSAGLLLWVAPPDDVVRQIGDMSPLWVLAAIALELGSCLSYVIIFRRFFPEPPRSVSRTGGLDRDGRGRRAARGQHLLGGGHRACCCAGTASAPAGS